MSIINLTSILQAKKELNDYLNSHPELRDFQTEIDQALKRAGSNKYNRMVVLQLMMRDCVHSQIEALNKLKALMANEPVSDPPSGETVENHEGYPEHSADVIKLSTFRSA